MMRRDIIRKSAQATLCSGVLVGFLLAAGCSDRKTSGNKLDDPEHKANMKGIMEQFKAKTQEAKAKSKSGGSRNTRHP